MGKKQVDELEAFNAGLGAGIEVAAKYPWIKWNEATGEVPDKDQRCVGIWIHKTKRSMAGCHAECFVMEEDHNGHLNKEGLWGAQLRNYTNPDFWIPMPNKSDH